MKYEDVKKIVDSIQGGVAIATMTTATIAKLKGGKKNPHQGRITKVTKGSTVQLFANTNDGAYERLVRGQIEAEGKSQEDFVVKPRAWGTRVGATPFIEHKEAFYLEVFLDKSGVVFYLLDGETPIGKEDIEGLEDVAKPVSDEAKEKAEASQGGIEKKVKVVTYSLDSIQSLSINE